MKNDIITIEHISKSFDGKKVLDDVSISIKKGEFVTILGPSGCGKTTMLRLIAGFLTPDEGQILMNGEDISAVPPYKRELNTVFQRYALFPHLDVYENIAFGLKLKDINRNDIDKRVRKVLKMVSMTDYEDRDVNSLSGGQQQRVAIARALVNQPQVLLLDEPLAALDLKMRKDMQIELKEMHKKLGITFIYVTHDQEEALTLSDTIVVMNEGKIQQIGRPKDIYDEPCNEFVADFIGESNLLDATMICDKRVSFIGKEFDCVDEGFGENQSVDVVIRPEDIYITPKLEMAQFLGTVTSCTFKGVHYEMLVNTDEGYEMMIQDYNAFDVGTRIGMFIRPFDIQVMKKERICNIFDGVISGADTVDFAGGTFKFKKTTNSLAEQTSVKVEIDFKNIELTDNKEDGIIYGNIKNIYYKGDHYYIEVVTAEDAHFYISTNDIWDKNDSVGIAIKPDDIRIISDNN